MQNCRMFGARGFGAVSDHFGFEKLVVKNCEVEELFDLELIIGGSNQEPVSIEITTLLCLSHLPDLKCIWKGPPNLISWIHLGDIEVGNCASLKKSLFTQSIAQKLSGLRTLYVYNCEELEYIVGPKDYSLQDEEQSCSFSDTCLSLLRKIKVEDCGSLKFVFPLSVAQGLPSLEEITINGACRLEQVIGDDRTNERATDKEILFPQLRILKLQDLPCLRRMVPAGYSLSSSSVVKVKEVFIKNCSIEELFDLREEIDTLSHEKRQQMSHSSTGAHTGLLNLQKIEVEECSNLRTLFNTIVAGALPKLNLITIKNCQNLETILAMGDGHSAHDYDLVERTCMPELRQIYIEGCHKLKSVFPLSVGQKLTQLTSCRIIDCPILGEHLTPIKESTGNIATPTKGSTGNLTTYIFLILVLIFCIFLLYLAPRFLDSLLKSCT
uniref:Disease resistance protein At4g27190-like leucine-rich repeats domain-containing protein n=1 Tax=Opuntia streptacantha TaxID=393608 RepID=A0A7C9AHL9_OPUST